jgi:hypothetical protein
MLARQLIGERWQAIAITPLAVTDTSGRPFPPFAKRRQGSCVNENTAPGKPRIITMRHARNAQRPLCTVGLAQACATGDGGYLEGLDYSVSDRAGCPLIDPEIWVEAGF